MTRAGRGVLLLAALVLPAVVRAEAGRISVGVIREDPGHKVRRQLVATLCGRFECVPASTVYTAGKVDLSKVREARVDGVLAGSLAGGRLRLSLYTTSRRPARSWSFVLSRRGRLDATTLDWIATDVESALTRPKPAPPPPRRPAPTAPPPGPAVPPTPPPPSAFSPSSAASRTPRPLRGAIEAGLWLTGRRLRYEGTTPAGTQPLQEFTASAIVSPTARLELYPGAWAGARPLVAGLGVFAEYSHSVGLKVEPASSSERHSATLTNLSGGVLWRIRPIGRAALTPAIGYQRLTLETADAGGAPITGLPDARMSGLDLRLDAEVSVTARIALLAGVRYAWWMGAEELLEDFFPGGSARGWGAGAGISVALAGPLSVRALVDYAATSYSLDADPTGTFRATGAKDSYLGGRAVVRAQF